MSKSKDGKVKLNLGCGMIKKDGWVNLDYNSEYDPDIQADLNKPLPLEDNTVDEIICHHCVEHLNNIINFIKEIYRVSANNCLIQIRYPHFSDRSAYADPTHRHYLSHASLQYFEDVHLNEPHALIHSVRLRTIKKRVYTPIKLFEVFANVNPDLWERLGFGIKEVEIHFRALK